MRITKEGLRRIVHEIIVQKLEERELAVTSQKLTEGYYGDTDQEKNMEAASFAEVKGTLRATLHAMIEEFGEDAARVAMDDAWEDAMVDVSNEDPAEEAEDERNRGARG